MDPWKSCCKESHSELDHKHISDHLLTKLWIYRMQSTCQSLMDRVHLTQGWLPSSHCLSGLAPSSCMHLRWSAMMAMSMSLEEVPLLVRLLGVKVDLMFAQSDRCYLSSSRNSQIDWWRWHVWLILNLLSLKQRYKSGSQSLDVLDCPKLAGNWFLTHSPFQNWS